MGPMPPDEAIPEITVLRLTIDRILTLTEVCEDEDRRVKLYNSLFLGAQRLITAMRTQSILCGEDKELLTAFWDAMELFRREQKFKNLTRTRCFPECNCLLGRYGTISS